MLRAAASPMFGSSENKENLMGSLVMMYAVLLFMRNKHLSAFQRAMSLLMTKGSATEEVCLHKLDLHFKCLSQGPET